MEATNPRRRERRVQSRAGPVPSSPNASLNTQRRLRPSELAAKPGVTPNAIVGPPTWVQPPSSADENWSPFSETSCFASGTAWRFEVKSKEKSMSIVEPRSNKIDGRHVERLAIVYVRQSSQQQTINHE